MSSGQKKPNAAARLAALPLVASVRSKLTVVYIDTKGRHPSLKSVCEGLESGVAAVLSPVIGKLESHISIANEVACKSLDWLETAFPILHTPTEQLVAIATKKMSEIQDVVSIAANGSAECVSMGVAWLMVRVEIPQNRGLPLVDRPVAAAAAGLEIALTRSEALVDRMFPPAEDDKEKEMVQRFEVTIQTRYFERLIALVTKIYRRMFHMNCRFTVIQTIVELPHYLQYQLFSAIIFLSQPHSRPANSQRFREPSRIIRAPEIRYMDSPSTTPPTRRLRRSMSENVCNVKGCVDR